MTNNRKFQLSQVTALAIAFGLVSCQATPETPNTSTTNRPKVVATTSILCDLTQTLAETSIDLTCLLKPGQDPHTYQASTGDRKALEDANLILYGGYDLEPDIIRLIQSSRNSALKVAVFEASIPDPILGEAHSHEGGEEDHHADEEPVPDPHVWHNVQNGVKIVETLSQQLTNLNPNQKELYSRNAQNLKTELNQIDAWIQTQINTIPASQRKLVTTHDALNYYSQAYGLAIASLQSTSAEAKPTAANVKELTNTIQQAGIPTIFVETTTNTKVIETVAKEANVKISDQPLFVDSLGEPGSAGDTYPKMLISNTRAIVEGLGGKYTPFEIKN